MQYDFSLANTTLHISCSPKQKDAMREVVMDYAANCVVWNDNLKVWIALWDLGAPSKWTIYKALKEAGIRAYVK
mgnify:CR=1 FL=1